MVVGVFQLFRFSLLRVRHRATGDRVLFVTEFRSTMRIVLLSTAMKGHRRVVIEIVAINNYLSLFLSQSSVRSSLFLSRSLLVATESCSANRCKCEAVVDDNQV